MTIEEFLTARLDELAADAEKARAAAARYPGDPLWVVTGPDNAVGVFYEPDRVLRQVAALRAVVGRQAGEHRNDGGICETCRDYDFHREYRPVPWPCPTARAIAGIWSDHPDYRQEWA